MRLLDLQAAILRSRRAMYSLRCTALHCATRTLSVTFQLMVPLRNA